MNEGNLVPMSKRTAEKQREICRLGGIRSGEVRRQKAELKAILNRLLDETTATIPDDSGRKITVSAAEGIAIKLIEQALNGNTKAFEIIRDTIGEKPVQNVNFCNTVSPEIIAEVEAVVMDAD